VDAKALALRLLRALIANRATSGAAPTAAA
jgi:hypothetical protein